MNKLKTFFQTLFKSCTSPAYYNHVVAAPMSFSWKYFFALNFFISLLIGLQLLLPIAFFDAVTNVKSAASLFPADLVITADQEGVRVNQELPYSIGFPPEFFDADADSDRVSDMPTNVVTFTSDDAVEGIASVQEYDSLFVLTSSTAYVLSDEDTQEIRAYPLPEFEETQVLDRGTIDSILTRITNHPIIKYKVYLPLILLFFLMILYPLMLVGRIMFLLVFSTAAWLLANIFMKAKGLSWGSVFQISIHSISPVIIIGNALSVLSLIFFSGWIYILAFLGWTLYVISQLQPAKRVVEGEVVYRPTQPKSAATKKKSATRKKSSKK